MECYYLHVRYQGECNIKKLHWGRVRGAISFVEGIAPFRFTKILKEGDKEIEIDLSLVNNDIEKKTTVILDIDSSLTNTDVLDIGPGLINADIEEKAIVVLDYEVIEVRAYNVIKKIQEEIKIPGKPYVPYSQTIERDLINKNLKLYEIIDDNYPSDIRKKYECSAVVAIVPTANKNDSIKNRFTIDPDISMRDIIAIEPETNNVTRRKIDMIRVKIAIQKGLL